MAVPTSKPLDAYVSGTKAWFPDATAGWVSATQSADPVLDASGNVTLTFVLDESGEEQVVNVTAAALEKSGVDALPPLRNPPLLEAADDLTSLSHLNEASVLHTILNRYQQRTIYTYSGIVLIAVNPFFNLICTVPRLSRRTPGAGKASSSPTCSPSPRTRTAA